MNFFFSESIVDKCPESLEIWLSITCFYVKGQLWYCYWFGRWNMFEKFGFSPETGHLCVQAKTNILQSCQPIKSHLSSKFCLLILVKGGKLLNIRTAFCKGGGNICFTTPKVFEGRRNSEWNVINFLWKNGELYDWHLMCCWAFHTDFTLTPPCVNEEDDCHAIPFPFHLCIYSMMFEIFFHGFTGGMSP